MTTTINVATDDQLKIWIQREIVEYLQGGLDWLEQYVQAALDELPVDVGQARILTEARQGIESASTSLSDGSWSEALDAVYDVVHAMGGLIPGERGSRAHELQHELAHVIDAIMAARLKCGSDAWRAWTPYWGSHILTEQSRYQPWLREAIEAWERGEQITLQSGYPEIISIIESDRQLIEAERQAETE